jgi:hypothetical protein
MASRPARALPVTTPPPIPLDALIARAGLTAQPHTLRAQRLPSAPAQGQAAGAARSPPALPLSPSAPSTLILPVSIATCTCGRTYRLPHRYVLGCYPGEGHTFHYVRTDLANPTLASLPRTIREDHITIPFCEACFDAPAPDHT